MLDSSAVLATIRGEPGAEHARLRLSNAAISAVNLAEVVTKLSEWKVPESARDQFITTLDVEVVPFDSDLAIKAGLLERFTRGRGISLGDRARLATAQRLGVPAVTGDRRWLELDLDIRIELFRP